MTDFAKKSVTLLIQRDGKEDASVGQFDQEELFIFMNSFENSGFKVRKMIDKETLKKYVKWKEINKSKQIPANQRVLNHIVENLYKNKKRKFEEDEEYEY